MCENVFYIYYANIFTYITYLLVLNLESSHLQMHSQTCHDIMGAHRGEGKSRRSSPPPPQKIKKNLQLFSKGGLVATFFSLWGAFSPFGGLFCYFYLHVGPFMLRFSPCGDFFCLSYVGAPSLGLPPPPAKTSAGSHMSC